MFIDRRDAGRQLATRLQKYKSERPVILALPRGGVEVGYEVARALDAPLDIIVSRKLGAPEQPELAFGAIVDGGEPITVLNPEVVEMYAIDEATIQRVARHELKEIERRQRAYRIDHPPAQIKNGAVILVDDGIATGASIRAAIGALRRIGVARLVLAVPVAPPETINELRPQVDDLVCLETPEAFFAVGAHYMNFNQTTDDLVIELMRRANAWSAAA